MTGSKTPFYIMALLLLCLSSMHGQQSLNASGGEAGGASGSMSFSIGQIAYESYTGNSGMISQGVHQAYLEIMVGNEELTDNFSVRLFPNPSASFTSIALNDLNPSTAWTYFSYQLFDLYGHLLNAEVIQSSPNRIPTSDLVPGMYILKVFYKNQPIKTFRFIKTD
jgi:hypothetical protein